MGCALSTPSPPLADSLPAKTTPVAAAELSAYEAACRADADLRTFDAALQTRTGRAVAPWLPQAPSTSAPSPSPPSRRSPAASSTTTPTSSTPSSPTSAKDTDLSNLVEGYFRTSLATLDFVGEFEKSLGHARDSQLLLHLAVRHLEDGEPPKAAAELEAFKSSGDHFSREFFAAFDSVYRQQMAVLVRMKERKRKIDSKLRSAERVSCVIFTSAFAAVLIFSVVALAPAMSIPVGSMGK